MNSEETDHTLGNVRLATEDQSSCDEVGEGAVGYSPNQDRCFHYTFGEFNDPVYHEEREERLPNGYGVNNSILNRRQRYQSFSIPSESTDEASSDQALDEIPIHVQRRHSFSGAAHTWNASPSCNCQSPITRNVPISRMRLENGVPRRGSLPIVISEPSREIWLQRNRRQRYSTPSSSYHDYYTQLNASNDLACVGSDLFLLFLREEIEHSQVQPPQYLIPQEDSSLSRDCEFMEMGRQLRSMAESFIKSEQRIRVRQRADSVNLNSLDFNSFSDLLFGMFQQGGLTSERVLVLFTFCSDLAIRALREMLQTRFYELTLWSRQYIVSWLSPWVQYHGGWAVVLERSVNEAYKAAVIGVCCMGMIAFWIYIRNNCH